MHFSAAVIAFAAAAGVSAHPSGHAHLHKHRDVEFKKAINPVTVTQTHYTTVVANPTPAPEAPKEEAPKKAAVKEESAPKESPKEESSSSSSSSSSSDDDKKSSSGSGKKSSGGEGKKAFCSQNTKRATLGEISYAGNVGSGKWGCNMMVVDAADADLYDYTAKFSGTGKKYGCTCFNKIGPTGDIDGFWHSALDFTVSEAGEDDVYVAFDTNSQGGCACGPGSEAPRTDLGQLAGTWLEFDWGSEPNGGNSGADASVLVAGEYKLPYYGMSVAANGKVCSWVKSDGSNEAAYMPGMEAEDGVGCKGYHKGKLEVLVGDNFKH